MAPLGTVTEPPAGSMTLTDRPARKPFPATVTAWATSLRTIGVGDTLDTLSGTGVGSGEGVVGDLSQPARMATAAIAEKTRRRRRRFHIYQDANGASHGCAVRFGTVAGWSPGAPQNVQ